MKQKFVAEFADRIVCGVKSVEGHGVKRVEREVVGSVERNHGAVRAHRTLQFAG